MKVLLKNSSSSGSSTNVMDIIIMENRWEVKLILLKKF